MGAKRGHRADVRFRRDAVSELASVEGKRDVSALKPLEQIRGDILTLQY